MAGDRGLGVEVTLQGSKFVEKTSEDQREKLLLIVQTPTANPSASSPFDSFETWNLSRPP